MSKSLSTFERKMKDPKFKKAYKESYKELLLSELMIVVMENDEKSVRQFAKETHLSPSVIQDLRTGKQQDIRVSNFINIAHALGYEIILEKNNERFLLQEKIGASKNQISIVSTC